MPMKLEFELSDQDLAYFQRMIEAKGACQDAIQVSQIVKAAESLLERARQNAAPAFILQTLEQLEPLVAMVTDPQWRLPVEDIRRVLDAMAYVADSKDLIPDDIPGLGYVDDAVMVELTCRNLRPELDAYRDFCDFREQETERRQKEGESETPVSRSDWLESRRKELHDKMHSHRSLFRRLTS